MSSIDQSLRIADFLHVLDDRAVASQVLVRQEQFVGMGHRPVLICATRDPSARPRIPDGVEILDLGIGRGRTVNALPRLVVALRAIRPDVFFAQHTGPNRTAILARMIGRIDTPIIVSECTHYSTFGWDHRAIRNRMTAALYPHADRVVGVSACVIDDLVAHFPAIADRTAVIPPAGPDPAALEALCSPVPDHPWYRDAARPTLLCSVANLVPRKGQETLVEALPRIRAAAGDVRLVLVGRHDDERFVAHLSARAAELGVQDHVWLAGYRENPFPFLARSDVFVHASHTEGCPTVVGEAQACGVPVVACDCPGGVAEAVEHGQSGVLVPLQRPDAMADAVVRVLSDSALRDTLIANGRERARATTPRRVAEAHLALAMTCIAERRLGRQRAS